ncbi:hypothetical protein ACOJBO_44850 [Rhizobium beringeri]
MLSFARDKATARIASEFYVNAINVMRGASTVSEYQGLPEQEAFDIEYWLLEEASCSACRSRRALPAASPSSPAAPAAWPGDGSASRRRRCLRGACRYRPGGARGHRSRFRQEMRR